MLNKRKQTLRCSHALLYTDAEVSGSDYASGGAQKLAASKQFSKDMIANSRYNTEPLLPFLRNAN